MFVQVIHAGLYYPKDSLKTRLCIEGREKLYALCAKQGIPHNNTKKWIVAQDDEQWKSCLGIHERAQSLSNVPTRLVSHEEAQRREPDVRARTGILESESTGIVDSHTLMMYLQGEFENNGGDCAFLTSVTGIEPLDSGKSGYKVSATSADGTEADFTAETLINSAGNGACRISNMILPKERQYTPYFAKGTYFSYSASHPKPSVLVYPVTKPGHAGLGTHLTLDLGGRVRFGPDVEWTDDPNDVKPRGAQLQRAIPEIQEYLPNINPEAIDLDYCGIRPKLAPAGSGFQDFIIRQEEGFPGLINLLGIESPGLTSSLAIAEMVERLLYR